MLRNEAIESSALKTLGEQDIVAAVEALLRVESLMAPLHRKVFDHIALSRNVELLSRLACHANADVRSAVASNHELPEDLGWKLAEDSAFTVRASLADNHFLAAFLLETLAEDEDERIAQRANRSLDRQNAPSPVETFSSKVFHWMHLALPTAKQTG